jgi:predicted nucleic acid-binding protein
MVKIKPKVVIDNLAKAQLREAYTYIKLDSPKSAEKVKVIVIGELYYVAAFSTQVAKNTADIPKVTSRYSILSLDELTTITYGSIKTGLRKKGKPIMQ